MIQPKNKEELRAVIAERIETKAEYCDLNDIDVSLITDMESLFEDSYFYGDISKWDVSHVTNMANMFTNTSFNGDISGCVPKFIADLIYDKYRILNQESNEL